MVAPLPPSPLAALVARVDEERSAHADDSGDLSARHKALVRAAGRAALEETLNPSQAVPELTIESLTAEWFAYAEVFGTNGMAAGGGRSESGEIPDVTLASQAKRSEEEVDGKTRRSTRDGGYVVLGIFATLVTVLASVHRTRVVACMAHG